MFLQSWILVRRGCQPAAEGSGNFHQAVWEKRLRVTWRPSPLRDGISRQDSTQEIGRESDWLAFLRDVEADFPAFRRNAREISFTGAHAKDNLVFFFFSCRAGNWIWHQNAVPNSAVTFKQPAPPSCPSSKDKLHSFSLNSRVRFFHTLKLNITDELEFCGHVFFRGDFWWSHEYTTYRILFF